MEYKDKSFYDRVMLRHADMQEEKRLWEPQQETIIEHYRPDITKYSDENSAEAGQFLHEIVEGTGAWSAGVMAKGFQGALVGPGMKWRRSVMGNMRLQGDDEINSWLQRLSDYMLEGVYRESNFYSVIAQDVLDGITIGSPVMLIEEDEATGKIVCKMPHYKENYLMRDWFGNDTAYHRKFELKAIDAAMMFGKDNLPPSVQQKLDSGDHFSKDKYLMVVYSRDDIIFKDLPESKLTRPQKSGILYNPPITRPWVMYYLPYDCEDRRYKGILPTNQPMGYFYKPFCAWHYFRNQHETYARTPAWYAIYDEKAGQAAWTAAYEVGEQAARPSMVAMQLMKGRVKSAPAGYTWARSDREYDRPPKRLFDRVDYPYTTDFVNQIDNKRKRHFHIDLFRLLDEYHKEHKQPPTAYEIAQMLAEKNVQIGPAIESFERGLLTPVDNRFIEIEMRSGRLLRETEPPDAVLMGAAGQITTRFTGRLAQAQKISVMYGRILDPLTMAQPIFEQWPDSRMKIKPSVLLERILEDSDFYQDAIATEEEFEEAMAMLNEQRMRDVELERAAMMADTVKKLQGKSEPGSPAKEMEAVA